MSEEIVASPKPVDVVPLASVEQLIRDTERELAELERVAADITAAADEADGIASGPGGPEDRWARIRTYREDAEEAARRDAETLIDLANAYARRRIAGARASLVLVPAEAVLRNPPPPVPATTVVVDAPTASAAAPVTAPAPAVEPEPRVDPADAVVTQRTAPTPVVPPTPASTTPASDAPPERDGFWSSSTPRRRVKSRSFPVPALLEAAAVLLLLVFILLRLS